MTSHPAAVAAAAAAAASYSSCCCLAAARRQPAVTHTRKLRTVLDVLLYISVAGTVAAVRVDDTGTAHSDSQRMSFVSVKAACGSLGPS